MTFADWFIEMCNKFNESPSAVASSIGCSEASGCYWANGERTPRKTTLRKIEAHFGEVFVSNAVSDVPAPAVAKIPVLGDVAAGIPIEAITDILDYEEIPAEMAGTGEYFALKIRGDSMEPKISAGDVVIVRRQPDVDSGELAVVLVNSDSATVKKIKKSPQGLMLISSNPAYEPMFYSNDDVRELPVTILGKVVELRAKF